MPLWLSIILVRLSNGIQLNPGPHFHNSYFNFTSWNINSIEKYNFQRVSLIEAHNTNFNYGLVSICETSINDSVELPEILLKEYKFVSANNPATTRHGGVGLFYKNSPICHLTNLFSVPSYLTNLCYNKLKSQLAYHYST